MSRYIAARLVAMVPVLIGVSIAIFLMIRLIPGDPVRIMLGENAAPADVAAFRHEMGYDRSLVVQYAQFAKRAVLLDFGRSTHTRRPVGADLEQRLPASLELAAVSLAFAVVIGCTGGILAAVRRNHPLGVMSTLLTLVGISIPSFWLGLLLIILFAVRIHIFPATGRGSLSSVILPGLSLGLGMAAVVGRMMRSSLLETLGQDYVRTARAKGLRETRVITGHALRSAFLPTVTVLGLEAGALIGGAVVTETVFAWPGIGQYLITAVTYRDYPAIQGTVLLTAVGFILMNLLVDLAYGWLDPRIRVS